MAGLKKDMRYARECVALIEDLDAGRITQAEYIKGLAMLNFWNNTGPKKPEKPDPRPHLPGLEAPTDA